MQERRRDTRQSLFYRCRVIGAQDAAPILCRIHNISKSGAHLSVEIDASVPDEFTLALTEDQSVSRFCKVLWRDGQNIGIQFIAAKRSAKPRKEYA